VAGRRRVPVGTGFLIRLRAASTLGVWEAAARAAAGAEVLTAVGLSKQIAEEQAALRRVATLVARATPPAEVFAAVTAEVGRLLKVDFTVLIRYDPDSTVTIIGTWTSTGAAAPTPVGTRLELGGRNVTSLVSQTGSPARMDDYADVSGALGEAGRGWGFRSAVGAPIRVEGRLWGVMTVAYTRAEPLPADTEARLADFTELIGTAIANAQARVELRGYAEEQAALRRVATLIARATPPEEVFAAVTAEVGRVLHPDVTILSRYDPEGVATILAAWSSTGAPAPTPAGTRFELGGRNVHTLVFETRRPARTVRAAASGPAADVFRLWGIRAAVGVPISVEGRLWGVMVAIFTSEQPLPAATETRLARFTELVATAIANAQARVELRGYAEEQAALRRVATLVARATVPAEVFAAVTAEVGRLLEVDFTHLCRYDPDGVATTAGIWNPTGGAEPVPGETRWSLGGWNVTTLVFRTGRPARIDDYADASGAGAVVGREWGFRSAVGVPISVEGRLWGFMLVAYTHEERLPADTEVRLAGFAELVATAIANAEGRAQLEDSRDELRRLADEQAALRRVATLVARGIPPAEVFAAVAHEVGSVLATDATVIVRLEPDGATTILARVGAHPAEFPVGSRWTPEPPLALAVALRTGRPARLDDFSQATDAYGDAIRRLGIRSGVATPIVVEGHLWGAIAVGTRREHLPADTEQRMAGFTELIGTAIANAEGHAQLEKSRDELRRLADEQAALRRVATLVARGIPPAEVFAAVAHEVGSVLDADGTVIVRLDPDGATTLVASVGAHLAELPVGSRWKPEPPVAVAVALRTCRPARCDNYSHAPGEYADAVRRLGLRSSVAAPIIVEGRLWGAIGAGARHGRLPVDTEHRMAGFTELIGTAIANADSRAQLTASRARIVTAADDARRRIERDLHDGTQQRLVALSLTLRLAQTTVPADLPQLQTRIGRVTDELTEATEELREIARGIHPAILSEGGLGPALRTLARRAAIPVEVKIRTDTRPAEPIEVAAYYVVSEALTNTTKHARASYAHVAVEERDGVLHLSMRDDGVGGADPAGGSGLIGLRDRVQALGGWIEVSSRPGDGTAIVVELPLQPA
jgi:GAF domain-containing protein